VARGNREGHPAVRVICRCWGVDDYRPVADEPRWGGPVVPVTRAVPPPVAGHRPWSTVLLACHVVVTVIAGLCAVVGTVVAAVDLADRGEEFDGLLAVLFGVLAVAGLAVGALALTLALLTRRGRRRADAGDPGLLRGVAITALVLTGLAVLAHGSSLLQAGAGGSAEVAVAQLVGFLPNALYGTAAWMTLRATRR
jgi:hypothetical protein